MCDGNYEGIEYDLCMGVNFALCDSLIRMNEDVLW